MRKVYKMVNGIPLYQHLKNDSVEDQMLLSDQDYGRFAEFLGKKKINYLIKKGGILNDIFPGICFESINRIKSKRKTAYGAQLGDTAYELSYKNGDLFEKKVVVFEIKYGMSHIKQGQIRKYCSMVENPGEYFPKANEVKVIYMFFNNIDTVSGKASYQICELNKELANKILSTEERREVSIDTSMEVIELDDDLKKIIDKLPSDATIKQYCDAISEWEKLAISKSIEIERNAPSGRLVPIYHIPGKNNV